MLPSFCCWLPKFLPQTINWHFRQNGSFIFPLFSLVECESVHRLSSAKNLNAHETWKMQGTSFVLFFDTFSSWCSVSYLFLANEGKVSFFKGIFNWKWYTTVVPAYLFRPISIAQVDERKIKKKLKSQSKNKLLLGFVGERGVNEREE